MQGHHSDKLISHELGKRICIRKVFDVDSAGGSTKLMVGLFHFYPKSPPWISKIWYLKLRCLPSRSSTDTYFPRWHGLGTRRILLSIHGAQAMLEICKTLRTTRISQKAKTIPTKTASILVLQKSAIALNVEGG